MPIRAGFDVRLVGHMQDDHARSRSSEQKEEDKRTHERLLRRLGEAYRALEKAKKASQEADDLRVKRDRHR
jgi:hypothetical protein